MSTRHLIAPDLLPLIDVQAAAPLSLQSLGELRKAGAVRQAGLPATGVDPQLRHASGMNGAPEVPLLHYRPVDQTPASAAVLHCHGGGMISGSASITACSSAASALDAGLPVFSVEYRLAPEVAFPGQLEVCHAVFAWMVDNAEILGIDPFRIAVCGDSAGGGLAASLALFERDLGECQPVAQVLTYPMLDCRTGGPDDPYLETATGEFCWTRTQNWVLSV